MSVATVLFGAFLTHCDVSYTKTYSNGTTRGWSAKPLFILGGIIVMLKGLAVI